MSDNNLSSHEDDSSREIQSLRERIEMLERENQKLRLSQNKRPRPDSDKEKEGEQCQSATFESESRTRLSPMDVERYSRQLLISGGFGVQGQLKLLSSSVLIIGAGGIGSTVILYLAASGVGKLTIVDFDHVDVSNLHRQVIHRSNDVGVNKAESARRAIKDLNPSVQCEIVKEPLTASNALELVSRHDCVVDASDNPLTRYTVNDACVIGGKPLVSGSAMGTEGQLTVYNYKGGSCYRCLYPKPNASEGSKTCSDNGVLGPVPGLIGVLQAVETMKILTDFGQVMYDKLTMYDSLQCSFLRIKKPPKQPKCPVCGPDATITSMVNYDKVSQAMRGPSCGIISPVYVDPSLNISCLNYKSVRDKGENHILLDVRVKEQFELCSLEGAVNLPLEKLEEKLSDVEKLSGGKKTIYCLCRRGIASAHATNILNKAMSKHSQIYSVKNIEGGLDSWRDKVDGNFPKY